MDKYSHAEACRDSLGRMGITTVQMCLSRTDIGSRVRTPSPGLPKKAIPSNNPPSSIPVRHVQQWKSPPPEPARRKRPVPQFDMNLEDIFNETLPTTKLPPEPPSYAQAPPSLNSLLPDQNQRQGQRPRLPPPQQQFQQQSEYAESSLPKPPLSLYNNNPSTSGTTSSLQTNSPFSLDFLEFDFGDSNTVPGDPQLEQNKKQSGPSLGSTKRSGTSSNLGLGIPVDGQHEGGRNDEYDFLDAFLVV